jgi:hypothetical protein
MRHNEGGISPLVGEDVFGIPAKPLEFTKEFFGMVFPCVPACILFSRETMASQKALEGR